MIINLTLTQAEESLAIPEEILPTYGSDKAAAFDLRADLHGRFIKFYDSVVGDFEGDIYTDTFKLEPGRRALIPTGFVFGIPEGYQMNIYSRSGHSWKDGVIVLNAPAIIDEDYTDETFVILYNSSSESFWIDHGDRIAQAQINPMNRVNLGSLGSRSGGLGSSGV